VTCSERCFALVDAAGKQKRALEQHRSWWIMPGGDQEYLVAALAEGVRSGGGCWMEAVEGIRQRVLSWRRESESRTMVKRENNILSHSS